MTAPPGSLELARRFYAALAATDPRALPDLLDPNFHAELTAGLPAGWGGVYTSAQDMLDRCWRPILRALDTHPVPNEYLPSGPDRLIVLGRYQGRHRQTGRIHDAAFVHVLRFENGRICSLLQITDSARWHDAVASRAEQTPVGAALGAEPFATAATSMLGIRIPLLQAPVGSAASAELAAAVSEAGALGMLALSWLEVSEIRRMLRAAAQLTSQPFAVNLVLEWDMRERLEVCLEEGVRLVSFFWGDPAPCVPIVHATGGIVLQTVGSVAEAQRAVAAGVDVLVAQGAEAGGHVRGNVSTMVLVPSIIDVVGESVPVIAAGGIADGRGLAAALMLGAAGAMIGTRFLLAEEADVHPVYAEALCRATAEEAIYTTVFEEGWPNAPHRALTNSTMRQWEAAGSPAKGARPGEGGTVAWRAGKPLLRYSDAIPTRSTDGAVEQLAMYAGQSVGLVQRRESAAAIVETIHRQTLEILARDGRAPHQQTERDVH